MNGQGKYCVKDVEEMAGIVEEHELESKTGGVVFAANLRICMKDPSVFVVLLRRCKESQLLLWTGTGEPAVLQSYVDWTRGYFEVQGVGGRVGFDAAVAGGVVEGYKNEFLIKAINVWNWAIGRGVE